MPFNSDRKILPVTTAACALALLFVGSGCLEPGGTTSDFGSYTGNAVGGYPDDDAGATNDQGASGGASTSGGTAGASSGDTAASTGGNGTSGGDDEDETGGSPGGTSEEDAGAVNPGSGSTGGGSTGGGSTGGGSTGGSSTGGSSTGPSTLTFNVLTKALGGRYQPRNIGAIWIEDGSGKFVKTLEKWARQRQQYLTNFNRSSGGNVTDAVTSATLSSHKTHRVQWDLTDASGKVVPDGSYRIRVECTDSNGAGDTVSVPFTKGGSAFSDSPANSSHFVNMSVSLQ